MFKRCFLLCFILFVFPHICYKHSNLIKLQISKFQIRFVLYKTKAICNNFQIIVTQIKFLFRFLLQERLQMNLMFFKILFDKLFPSILESVCIFSLYIMITSPCNVYPLIPHFYVAKVGFTGVYLFSYFALKHGLRVLVRTASMRRF